VRHDQFPVVTRRRPEWQPCCPQVGRWGRKMTLPLVMTLLGQPAVSAEVDPSRCCHVSAAKPGRNAIPDTLGINEQRIILSFALGALFVIGLTAQPVRAQFQDFTPEHRLERRSVQTQSLGALRIINGQLAQPGAWPFAVLVEAHTDRGLQRCGGSLIAPTRVLTAAHCVHPVGTPSVLPSSRLRVRFGHVNLNHPSVQSRSVVQVAVHENFRWRTEEELKRYGFDVAVLTVSASIPLPTITLASAADIGRLGQPPTSATVVGWGQTQDSIVSDVLLQITLPLVDRETCRRSHPHIGPTNHVICAGFRQGGSDSCSGDSGGPLFTFPAGAASLREVVQIGIVSWGEQCALPERYGIYENVGVHEAWIRRHAPEARFSRLVQDGDEFQAVGPGEQPSLSLALLDGTAVTRGGPMRLRLISSVSGHLVLLSENRDPSTGQTELVRAIPQTGIGLIRGPVRVERGQPMELPPPDREWAAPLLPGRYTMIAYIFPTEQEAAAFADRFPPVRQIGIGAAAGRQRLHAEAAALRAVGSSDALRLQLLGFAGSANALPRIISRSLTYEVR